MENLKDNFIITLKILRDILEKKQEALEGILGITQNQETVLQSPPSAERTSFFNQCNVEKQRYIDQVREYDEVFQGFFDTVKDNLQEKADENVSESKPEITRIKALISQVVELDVRIRAQEQKNTGLLKPKNLELKSLNLKTAGYRNRALGELNKHRKN